MEDKKRILVNKSTVRAFLRETGMRASQDAIWELQTQLSLIIKRIANKAAESVRERNAKTITADDITIAVTAK